MKFLKWFSLFFMSICVTFAIGLFVGFRMEKFFYPQEVKDMVLQAKEPEKEIIVRQEASVEEDAQAGNALSETQVIAVFSNEERIGADTTYVIIERNMDTDEKVETIGRIPEMYMGMNREQFLSCMEDYEASPPLIELERGFVSLEVQSFSGSRVEVLMNYSYVKPSKSFYVVVYDGMVTVLLEDKETLYLQTGMEVLDLPETIQQELIQGMFVADEESLYDFLENYTS